MELKGLRGLCRALLGCQTRLTEALSELDFLGAVDGLAGPLGLKLERGGGGVGGAVTGIGNRRSMISRLRVEFSL